MPKIDTTPKALKPFTSLGMELSEPNGGNQAVGDCPFCGKEGKFYVNAADGQWDCKLCGGKGNAFTFLRKVHQFGTDMPSEGMEALSKRRNLISPETLMAWGVVPNLLEDVWLVPGYGPDGKLNQLYRYVKERDGKMRLYATEGIEHQLHGVNLFDDSKQTVYLCEGPWDAMALWEMLRLVRDDGKGKLVRTTNVESSLYADSNVLAVPGCNVFKESWLPLFAGKKVVFCYDNDHPRTNEKTGQLIPPGSLEGMKRAVRMMRLAERKAASVHYLCWGDEGYTKNHPSGYDVRDALGEVKTLSDKVVRLANLIDMVKPIPAEWMGGAVPAHVIEGSLDIKLLGCSDWKTLEAAWHRAFTWGDRLSCGLSSLLACVTSTPLPEDQLWLKMVGPPSCGKSVLCEALSTALTHVLPISNFRGFHSGYKTDKEGEQDHGLVPLLQDKTMVIKDGDTLLQAPNRDQILAEGRDLYDGDSRTHYRHGVRRNYTDRRFTFILSGTERLRELDTSELGERFIDIVLVDGMSHEKERKIGVMKLNRLALRLGMNISSNGDGHGPDDDRAAVKSDTELMRAQRLTGGYITYLRKNAMDLIHGMKFPPEMSDRCQRLGEFVSYMRSRPSAKQHEKAQRELSFRLVTQFGKLAICTAVVMNKKGVDDEVIRRVTMSALDTARGRVLNLVRAMYDRMELRPSVESLAILTNESKEECQKLLVFLRKIKVVDIDHPILPTGRPGKGQWVLTGHITSLYEEVVENA